MQETQVRSLIPVDLTCLGAVKSLGHSGLGAATTQALGALDPVFWDKRCHLSEKPAHSNESYPHSLKLEKSPCSSEDQHSTKTFYSTKINNIKGKALSQRP